MHNWTKNSFDICHRFPLWSFHSLKLTSGLIFQFSLILFLLKRLPVKFPPPDIHKEARSQNKLKHIYFPCTKLENCSDAKEERDDGGQRKKQQQIFSAVKIEPLETCSTRLVRLSALIPASCLYVFLPKRQRKHRSKSDFSTPLFDVWLGLECVFPQFFFSRLDFNLFSIWIIAAQRNVCGWLTPEVRTDWLDQSEKIIFVHLVGYTIDRERPNCCLIDFLVNEALIYRIKRTCLVFLSMRNLTANENVSHENFYPINHWTNFSVVFIGRWKMLLEKHHGETRVHSNLRSTLRV